MRVMLETVLVLDGVEYCPGYHHIDESYRVMLEETALTNNRIHVLDPGDEEVQEAQREDKE